ncbi:MAG: hypothetical protein HPY83_03120 [Anaerolineae bacterium]|nr:hypothetical protein [Anaerolineae bacterium]
MRPRWLGFAVLVAIASALAVVGPSVTAQSQPTIVANATCTWSGTWDTTYGTMVLAQAGDHVTGTYTYNGGRIDGTVTGTLLSGTWSEAPDYLPPDSAGDIEFTMAADCGSFSGRWRYGSTGDWQGWDGTKVMAFTAGPDQYVPVDAGPQTIPGWATEISTPPGVDWAFMVTTGQKSLFSAWPDVDNNGTLTFTPAAGARGTATVEVWMAYGYPDTAETEHQTFHIYIGMARIFVPCAFRSLG